MGKNTFQIIHKGSAVGETSINVQLPDREIIDQAKGTDITTVNEEGTVLFQVKHEFVNVGESIAQIKYNTSVKLSQRGTVLVSQFRQEVTSRGEEVWYYKNSIGTFEGTLSQAEMAFPEIDFSELDGIERIYQYNPEFGKVTNTKYHPPEWVTLNEFDAEEDNGGEPTTWENWADATQTALDIAGMIPVVGEIADCINGVISLTRGNYGEAALSFAAMIPFIGNAVTGAKILNKAKKLKKIIHPEDAKGVYDLIIKNGDDIQGYVGQSKNIYQRFIQHFNPKRGKFFQNIVENGSIIHKMKGSTKLEREMYEQFIILERYEGQINPKKNPLAKLLNKVNPVGGRFDLKTAEGLKLFKKEAVKIANKYNLPTTFDPPNF